MRLTFLGGRRALTAAAFLLLLVAPGCEKSSSPLYPVQGRVTLEDGKPLSQGVVIFERRDGGGVITARGDLKSDGSYRLSTNKLGDGAPTGKYRVLINPQEISDVPDEERKLPFDNKYLKFETSGLEFEVKAGQNDFQIKLAPPTPKDADKAAPKGDAKGDPKGGGGSH